MSGTLPAPLGRVCPTRLAFDIDREADRKVEVTFTLDRQRSQEAERIVCLTFGRKQ
jgi:hypothetical protein